MLQTQALKKEKGDEEGCELGCTKVGPGNS